MTAKVGKGGKAKAPGGLPGVGDPAWVESLQRRLATWFTANARRLPWRENRDPYRIWVSETMLQQTTVAMVLPYFQRFLDAFPDVSALAAADEHEVLRLWEGLGYYRRARQLHRAARQIVAEHAGQFPRDYESARALPGIGRYTAGAVLSFAFDARLPILEANTIRAYARLLAYRDDPRSTAGQKRLWQVAEEWLPERGAGVFNHAVMELGSEICVPREPRCGECPVAALCPTRALGLQAEIPLAAKRAKPTDVREASVVVENEGRVLIFKRQEPERWAGLWDFPRFPLESESRKGVAQELATKVIAMTSVAIQRPRLLTTLRHGVTRFRITLDCYAASVKPAKRGSKLKVSPPRREVRWVRPDELDEYALSVTGRKLAKLIGERAK